MFSVFQELSVKINKKQGKNIYNYNTYAIIDFDLTEFGFFVFIINNSKSIILIIKNLSAISVFE